MQQWRKEYLGVLLVLGVFGFLLNVSAPVRAQGSTTGHVLVKTKAGVNATKLAGDYLTYVEDHVPKTTLYTLATPASTDDPTFAKLLARDSRVLFAEPDSDTYSPEFGHTGFHFAFDGGPDPGSYVNSAAYTQVDYGNTRKLSTGKGIIVAVLDTGATFTHPKLKGHYLSGYNVIDPSSPPIEQADGATNEAMGHGTMIAGIIAKLAPMAKILPVRVLNGDGNGTMLDVIKGVNYAIASHARVISLSFGSTQPSSALNDTLDQAEAAGIVIVVAAGNDDVEQPPYPAVGRGAIPVASVEDTNQKSDYSNFGSFVRIVAPGTGIRSTYYDGGYADWSGTSFAVPFISAASALILSAHPTYTAEMVRSSLRKTAHSVDSMNPAYKGKLGDGIVDIQAAVLETGH